MNPESMQDLLEKKRRTKRDLSDLLGTETTNIDKYNKIIKGKRSSYEYIKCGNLLSPPQSTLLLVYGYNAL